MKSKLVFFAIFIVCCSSDVPQDLTFMGTWLPDRYVDILLTQRSPYKAFQSLRGISCIEVRAIESDTSVLGVLVYANQGNQIKIIHSQKGKNSFTVVNDLAEGQANNLKIDLNENRFDTSIVLSYSNRKFPSKKFIRVSHTIVKNPFDSLTNSLFDGTYLVYNSNHSIKLFDKAIFNGRGKIVNFDRFKFFDVASDYATQDENFDIINFQGNRPDEAKWFHFKFVGDEIYLYEIVSRDTRQYVGELSFVFVKVK